MMAGFLALGIDKKEANVKIVIIFIKIISK